VPDRPQHLHHPDQPIGAARGITLDEVVAALHRMRDEIDFLLASLAPSAEATNELVGLNMGEAALHILVQSKKPMRAPDIWKRMITRGYSSKKGDRSHASAVSWALSLRLKQYGDVEKVGRGVWRARISDSPLNETDDAA